MILLKTRLPAAVAVTLMLSGPNGASAQGIAVEDNKHAQERERDETASKKSVEQKDNEKGQKKAVVCTYSNKYRSQLFALSPKQALDRNPANAAMVRHYAKKYGVPESLALSVAYSEGRLDTCAGSHTGVKGVMQLTKRTGRGLGFDRDINEQNIEGGVKYLSGGVQKCGSSNYTCLASYYNGSTAAEQRGWANSVGRFDPVFSQYVKNGTVPDAAGPAFSVSTLDSGSGGASQKGAVKTVNNVNEGLAKSHSQQQQMNGIIDGLEQGVGGSSEYKDSWDGNSQARSINAQLLNQLISASLLANQLLNSDLQGNLTSLSSASGMMKSEHETNPFSCDPVILRKSNVPVNQWPACAVAREGAGESSDRIDELNPEAASQFVEDMQNKAR